MPTRCICPFLAIYAKAILEAAQGLRLAHDQALLRAGAPLAIVKTLLTNCWHSFVGRTTDIAEYDCGDDCRFKKIFFGMLLCTVTKEERWYAMVQT